MNPILRINFNNRFWSSLGAAITVLLIAVLPVSAATEPLTVAIFDFESKDEPVRDLGPKIATIINAALSVESHIITVERAELQKALGEQEMSLSGTVSADTAAKVGHLTGAKVLVTGRVFIVDKERVIVAKIISSETSRVYGELSKASVTSAVTDQAGGLAKNIAATIALKGETLLAKVETREQLVERLKKKIGAAKLPSVSVKIPEQHFGAPVRDPAAQTELLLILQQCGFTIEDDRSSSKAEIEITGEAFSALGTRKGNLISCKSRVEIKAHDMRFRTLKLADRQTSVAVDIAEQTAAKSALQNAAAELAERVVIKLAQ